MRTRSTAYALGAVLIATGATATCLLAVASGAEAREIRRSWSATGPYGHSAYGQSHIYRGGGSAHGTRSVQGPYGRGGTGSFSRSCAGGTCTRNSTWTSNSGRTWNRSGTVTRNGPGNWSSQGTTTGPNGGVWTRSGSYRNYGDGTWNRNRTVTGPNGGTWNKTVNGACGGWTCSRSVTVTGPNGGTATRNRWVTYD